MVIEDRDWDVTPGGSDEMLETLCLDELPIVFCNKDELISHLYIIKSPIDDTRDYECSLPICRC